MPGALLGIVDDYGQASMDGLPVIRVGLQIDGRREQRVDEANLVTVQFDDARLSRTQQTLLSGLPYRVGNEPDSRLRNRCRDQQRPLCLLRKDCQAPAKELAELTGHRERLARLRLATSLLERSCQLEREERISRRRLVKALYRRPR
jgi:hypothetical protein